VWITEHGPQGGDELNLVLRGRNYGWPVVGFGVNYETGTAIHGGTHRAGMEQPAHVWVPSTGVSGLLLYNGDRFPQWRGSLFAGGLSGQQIARLTLNGREVVIEETLIHRMGSVAMCARARIATYTWLSTATRGGTRLPFTGSSPPTRTRLRIRGGIRERSGQNRHSCPGRALVDDSKDPPQAGG